MDGGATPTCVGLLLGPPVGGGCRVPDCETGPPVVWLSSTYSAAICASPFALFSASIMTSSGTSLPTKFRIFKTVSRFPYCSRGCASFCFCSRCAASPCKSSNTLSRSPRQRVKASFTTSMETENMFAKPLHSSAVMRTTRGPAAGAPPDVPTVGLAVCGVCRSI